MNLNPSQESAIRHKEGPMLVLAGPGSGKTLVITERTRYLIEECQVSPSNILVITFTKAAATEMKQRFKRRIGRDCPVTFGTFHAVFFMILKHAYHYSAENIIKEEAKKVIAVHIIGEINKPGIVELEEGARVIDAIKKAGGTTEKADLAQINLAYILKDGQKIYIPNTEDNDKKIEYNTANIENNIKEEKININTADEDELQRLPGVGASTAAKIIKYREENGSFRKIEDIQNVKGIGEAKYNDLKEQIEV